MRVFAMPTTGPGTAGEMARRAILDGADLILAAGGDGTINEVANGMIHSEVPLGILPGGTANVLAMELGVGGNIERAASRIQDCIPERIAMGLLRTPAGEPRHFLMMAGVGLDAHIVYHLNLRVKAALGKVAYWIGGFSQLTRNLEEFDVRINGATIRCSFALVSRVRNYGGDLEIARGACLLDDQFEAVLFSGESPIRYLIYMLGVVTGRLQSMKGVSVQRTTNIEFSRAADNRVYVQIDGEYAGGLPAGLEIVPRALTLLVPQKFRERFASYRGQQKDLQQVG